MRNFSFFAAGLCLMSLFAACSEEIGDIKPEGGDVDSMRITNFDQKQFLQAKFVLVDSMGGFVQRVNGVPLDPADTTVLYIGVKDVAEAKSIFKGWLAPDAEPIENGDVITVDLLDENGHEQGQVNFTPKMEYAPEPLVAVVNFSEGTDMKYVSEVKFIPEGSWPNNSESPYAVGETVSMETIDEGVQKWLCIREAKQGISGILVYLSHETNFVFPDIDNNIYYFFRPNPIISTISEVAAITSANWDVFQPMFTAAGMTLADEYYWFYTNRISKYEPFYELFSINLKSTDLVSEPAIISGEYFDKFSWKHYLQVSYFGEVN